MTQSTHLKRALGEELQLHTVLVNTGQNLPVERGDIPPWLLAATDKLAITGCSSFCSALGDCELGLTRVQGGGLLYLRNEVGRAGIAVLAWLPVREDYLWSELLRAREGIPELRVPSERESAFLQRPALPWLGVLLWPVFVNGSGARQAYQVEVIFWSAAFSVINQCRNEKQTEHPGKPPNPRPIRNSRLCRNR